MKPHGVQHNWNLRIYTPEDIQYKTSEILLHLKMYYDQAASAPEPFTYEALVKPLLEAQRYISAMGAIVTFPRHVSTSPELRAASIHAVRLLDEVNTELSMRNDIFDKLVAFKEFLNRYTTSENISPEYKRCLDRLVQIGRRNGLHLRPESQQKLKHLKKRLSDLTIQFSINLGKDNTELLFTLEELDGLSEHFLEILEKDEKTGKFVVNMKYPHFFSISRKCHIPATRRIIEIAYQSRCMNANTRLLEEILELRHKEATLLCFSNHAAYVQDLLMVKRPEHVDIFLSELVEKFQPLWNKERDEMLRLKRRVCHQHGYKFENKIELWDYRYYANLISEEIYDVNQEKLMEYFPVYVVTKGMIGIYEELLSIRFTLLPDADRWDDAVLVYQINDHETSELMGYIYMDLFPREGKFQHACCIPMQPGCLNKAGKKQPSVAAILANFSVPLNGNPSLMDHKEIETYFHEFGHLMHGVCSRAETALFFGTRVETDFMETPSQMLENWVWEKEPLKRISEHYRTKSALPDEMIEKLSESRKANAGGMNLRQLVLATFDQRVHRIGKCDTQAVYAEVLQEIMGVDAIPYTNVAANFNHICVGYSARYYSYLWSEVFSADMFKSMFKKRGLFNKESGLKYRKLILEPGGSIDAAHMLQNFLGRPPTNFAFLSSKGLTPTNEIFR